MVENRNDLSFHGLQNQPPDKMWACLFRSFQVVGGQEQAIIRQELF